MNRKFLFLLFLIGSLSLSFLFLNFKDVIHLDWRDDKFTQQEPNEIKDVEILVDLPDNIKKVRVASPDLDGGVSAEVNAKKEGQSLRIPVPYIKYWTMVVLETEK